MDQNLIWNQGLSPPLPAINFNVDDMLVPRLNGIYTNLKICRDGYGEVLFPGETYANNIELVKTVILEKASIEVYPNVLIKPPVGQGLNKPAIVTFHNIWDTKTETKLDSDEFSRKLAHRIERIGGRFVSYCFQTGHLTFAVPHFSKYGLNDSDEELEIAPQDNNDATNVKTTKEPEKQQIAANLANKKLKSLDKSVLDSLQFQTDNSDSPLELDISDIDNLDDVPQPSEMTEIDQFDNVFSPRQLAFQYNSQRIIGMKASLFQDDYQEVDMEMTNVKEITIDKYTPSLKSAAVTPRTPTIYEKKNKKSDPTTDLLERHTLMTSILDWRSQDHKFVGTSKYLKTLPKFQKSILFGKQDYIADAGCFMGRSFRVGWATNLELAHIGKPLGIPADKLMDQNFPLFSLNSMTDALKIPDFAVLKSKLESIPDDDLEILTTTLIKNMEIQLQFNELKTSEGIPFFEPKTGVDLLHAHAQRIKQLSSETNAYAPGSGRLTGMQQMFDLCVALWGNLPNFNDSTSNHYNHRDDRKSALSNWLMKSTKERLLQEVQSQKFNPDGYLPTLYSFLTGRRISEANMLAKEHDDWRLALQVAQASSCGVNRVYLQRQLENWHQYNVDSFIDKQRLKIYALLAGSLIWNPDHDVSVNCCENLDWKRAFAVHLWYHCPATASIADAVAEFESSFQGTSQNGKYSQPPYPTYIENDPDLLMTLFDEELDMMAENINTAPHDICYHLLKLYCDRSTRLDKLLAPLTYCPSHLDYTNSWLLFQVLLSLGYKHLPNYQVHQLHNNFATQLESLGLWEWAIFVALHIPEPKRRKSVVMEYLNRHVMFRNDEEYQEKEIFLTDKLGIPKKWIYAAKAMLARALSSPRDEAWCLLKSNDWTRSHKIIMERIAPDCIINENFSYLKQFLQELSPLERSSSIADWANGGEVCLDYIKISEAVDEVVKGRVSAYDLEAMQPRLLSLGKRICNLRCNTARDTLCQSEMAKKTASLLRAVLELQKAKEGGRVNEHQLAPYLSKLPMPEDYALQELRTMTRSYMLELTNTS